MRSCSTRSTGAPCGTAMRYTEASNSPDTYAVRPSGVNATSRGRLPTSTDLTIFSVPVSMTDTELSDSFVTRTQRPSGVMPTPSGSRPTGTRPTTAPLGTSTTDIVAASSLATNSLLPSGLRANCSGSEPACSTCTTLWVAVSTIAMPSALRSRSSLAHSSSGTDGGHLGSPLTATNSRDPSRLSFIPRGRLPTAIVAIVAAVSASSTVTLCPSSLETYKRAASAGHASTTATMPSHRMRRGVRASEQTDSAHIEVAAVVLERHCGPPPGYR